MFLKRLEAPRRPETSTQACIRNHFVTKLQLQIKGGQMLRCLLSRILVLISWDDAAVVSIPGVEDEMGLLAGR